MSSADNRWQARFINQFYQFFMPVSFENSRVRRSLIPALEAISNLTRQDLNGIFSTGQTVALSAHHEIKSTHGRQKIVPFYQCLLPLRGQLVSSIGDSYRRYFRLALAHPRHTGRDPDKWALAHLQPAIETTLKWLRDWYILACDGENQWVRNVGSTDFVPGLSLTIPITAPPPLGSPKSWLAPAWLFEVSLVLVGIGLLKTEHVPAADPEQRLGTAHTRLLLKGARRVFLFELDTVIGRVRNEEMAAASAIPTEAVGSESRRHINRKGWQQKEKLYSAIQKAMNGNPSLQGMEFCAELDRRHAPPLYDWRKSGEWREGLTWKEAWVKPGLRKKIRRVRQEALKRH